MIKFLFKSKGSLPSKPPSKYPEILRYSGDFKIIIDNKIYFEDEEFSIYEFLYYVNKWCETAEQIMEYNCIDTDENPLVSFIPYENKWKISSPWENYANNVFFTTEELNNAIIALKEQLMGTR